MIGAVKKREIFAERMTPQKPVIDTDVVALRAELFVGNSLGLVQQGQKLCAFIRFKVKERADVSLGDDQGVARRDRECIAHNQPQKGWSQSRETAAGYRRGKALCC